LPTEKFRNAKNNSFKSKLRISRKKRDDNKRRNSSKLQSLWLKLKSLTRKPSTSSTKEFTKRNNLSRKLWITTEPKPRERKNISRRSEEPKPRRNSKSKDSESSKREPQIDRQKSMPLELREPLKSPKDKRELRRRRSKSTRLRSFRRWLRLEISSSLRRRDFLLNKLNKRETSS
jgi:hypothetical protein